ncbi:MAG TPA: carboxymuconolactone decarboxylase family protein [Chloroflexota bacterium]|nr:carboxymuconolactone decarboxylase family protein [Chloroflexota bacterium]
MEKHYPEYFDHLRGRSVALRHELPGVMNGFAEMYRQAMVEGALTTKTKELIALGIAIAVHCDGCIAAHVQDAMRAGASRPEIVETIGVAVLMGGGPSAMYGAEALEALEQFEARAAAKRAQAQPA